jgi:hypothetical protein
MASNVIGSGLNNSASPKWDKTGSLSGKKLFVIGLQIYESIVLSQFLELDTLQLLLF